MIKIEIYRFKKNKETAHKLIEPTEEMKKKYQEVFDYDPTDKEVERHYNKEFKTGLNLMIGSY